MDAAPNVRVDREYMNGVEMEIARDTLYWMADVIDALTKAGALYGQLVLPPHEAQMKRQAMSRPDGAMGVQQ